MIIHCILDHLNMEGNPAAVSAGIAKVTTTCVKQIEGQRGAPEDLGEVLM